MLTRQQRHLSLIVLLLLLTNVSPQVLGWSSELQLKHLKNTASTPHPTAPTQTHTHTWPGFVPHFMFETGHRTEVPFAVFSLFSLFNSDVLLLERRLHHIPRRWGCTPRMTTAWRRVANQLVGRGHGPPPCTAWWGSPAVAAASPACVDRVKLGT